MYNVWSLGFFSYHFHTTSCTCWEAMQLTQESVQKPKETSGKMGSVAYYYLVNVYSLCVQFAEKFQEFKEAARLAKEKSQEKMELTSTPSQVCVMDLFSCVSLNFLGPSYPLCQSEVWKNNGKINYQNIYRSVLFNKSRLTKNT